LAPLRAIYEILDTAGIKRPANDIEFVLAVEALAPETGFSRTEKYAALLPKI
jgi:hypothetical protein